MSRHVIHQIVESRNLEALERLAQSMKTYRELMILATEEGIDHGELEYLLSLI